MYTSSQSGGIFNCPYPTGLRTDWHRDDDRLDCYTNRTHLLCSLRVWTRWFEDCRGRAGRYEACKRERNSSLAPQVSREDQSAESPDGSVAYACRDATTQSLPTVKETFEEASKPGKSLRSGSLSTDWWWARKG
ncbi:unnamed protein product [Protopolystoma xenopodis]|uniref:Uncharacterized protein n=1 Tax=Protopolystoma xenopodis TaxID=117903 RepID=A0A3S5A6B5_9PLAT|nr:unnamed protein product [Protopolystoma xenopodis]